MKTCLLLVALFAGPAAAADPPAATLPAKQRDEVVKKYTDAGLPSPDAAWGGEEYTAALKALEAIKKRGKLPLPRRDVLLYRPLFQRLVSEENLAFLADDKLTPGDAIDEANVMIAAVVGLLGMYNDPSVPDLATSPQPYGTEVLELALFAMKISNGLLRVLGEVEKTKTDEDRKAPSYISGLKEVRAGVNQALEGSRSVLGELGVYSERDLANFAVEFGKLAPAHLAFLPAEDRARHLKGFKKLAKSHPIPTVRKALADLAECVESKK